ncbi:MAG: M20 family metallopeptidase [Candidatus Omnitrophica bacterium]|nr:M20 family metallopeptidase [Candidatus Omnitrophota bacterium]
MVDKNRLIKLLQALIRIDSQNPPGNESEIAFFVKRYLEKLKLKARIYEFKKARANIIAVLETGSKSKGLLITPHLDTVPAGKNWSFDPFAGKISQGKIYGLGATDCKVNLACSLEAIHSIVETKTSLSYNLIFAATADEESGSGLGLIPLLKKGILKPDAAVVLDADDFDIIVTQKGLMHLKIKVKGRRAHGAYPWMGVNAIDKAVDILKEVKAWELQGVKNKYLRPPTINIGTIKGGDKVNIVADWCEFELDFRFLPGMSAEKILAGLKRVIRKHSGKFEIEIEGIQKPYEIESSHALVHYLKEGMKKVGLRPRIRGSEGATVITFFQDEHIPAVATGFGAGGCAHTIDEYVKIDSVCKGAVMLEEFLKSYRF